MFVQSLENLEKSGNKICVRENLKKSWKTYLPSLVNHLCGPCIDIRTNKEQAKVFNVRDLNIGPPTFGRKWSYKITPVVSSKLVVTVIFLI